MIKCNALRDLAPFVQLKKRENAHGGLLLFSKSKIPPWVFSRFLNCITGTKSRKTSHIYNKFKELLSQRLEQVV